MLKLCQKCLNKLNDNDYVEFTARATYHEIKSPVSYALDKSDIQVVGELAHADCRNPGD